MAPPPLPTPPPRLRPPVLAELVGQDHSLPHVPVGWWQERLSCGDSTSHKRTLVGAEQSETELEEGDVSNLKHLEKRDVDLLALLEQVFGRDTLAGLHQEDGIPDGGQGARFPEGGGAANMDGLVALGCSC